MIITYSMAYKEVLVLLKYYLKEEEYNKIPKDKIEFFEKNADKNYRYEIDKNKSYEEQQISQKANSIIVSLYRDYFTNDEEKKKLDEILNLNDLKAKKIKAESQNKNRTKLEIKEDGEDIKEKLQLIEKKENIFQKIWDKLRKISKR